MTTLASGASGLLDDPLVRRSVSVLAAGQADSGALVASPSFSQYGYGWLRDGAFCAHALDLVGERGRAGAFHRWAADCIVRHATLVHEATAVLRAGGTPAHDALLPTRFTLDGRIEDGGADAWPNFQLDGYGMWLWALEEHVRAGGSLAGLEEAVALAAAYLSAAWRLPCYGCWEELDDGEHAATIAAVAAGLAGAARLLDDAEHADTARLVGDHLLARFVADGRFRRCAGDPRVDGSLLWVSVPFGLLPPDDGVVAATVAAVRRDLVGPGGGVYRYLGDTYYGGGQWILLTCSLAWHDAVLGDGDAGRAGRDWVRAQARDGGHLPEQVTDHAQEPRMVEPWVERWGAVATPLLWSHAMYVIAESAARRSRWRPFL